MKLLIELLPEINLINNEKLRIDTLKTWELAIEQSVLSIKDIEELPVIIPGYDASKISFINHKRAVTHIAYQCALKFNEFLKDDLEVNIDYVIAGALLTDVGKLLEYQLDQYGEVVHGIYGKYVRHPFSGVSLAERCGILPQVCHIIATHAGEGDMIQRSAEANIVHHADFMVYFSLKDRLVI